MFGLIVAGRPVDAAPSAITETQYAFKISPSPSFNHIVVFILPGIQLPPGTAATVYVQIPPSQEFRLLGGIGPGKESAIFKIGGLNSSSFSSSALAGGDGDVMVDDAASGAAVPNGDIVIGISIEPAANVEAQLATLKSNSNSNSAGTGGGGGDAQALVKMNAIPNARLTTKVLAQRIIGNAFNFLASFGSDTVPLKAFQDWWTKFEKKVELDPSFLEREG